MAQKPTVQEIKEWFNQTNPHGLKGADVQEISARNHLIYRVDGTDGKQYCLRSINPESYRRNEWIPMREEYDVLRAIARTGLGPRVYAYEERCRLPFMIQEWVEGICFNEIKPLSRNHLAEAARAIANLNAASASMISLLSPALVKKYTYYCYDYRLAVWYARLAYACVKTRRRDVVRWTGRIIPVLHRAGRRLSQERKLLSAQSLSFHFDGAHTGNVYWRNGAVVFLDWQRVSFRNDPTFTLVRFAASINKDGSVSRLLWNTMFTAYKNIHNVDNFEKMAHTRLIERLVSDFVWEVWNYSRVGNSGPLETATNVAQRFAVLNKVF